MEVEESFDTAFDEFKKNEGDNLYKQYVQEMNKEDDFEEFARQYFEDLQ